MGIGSKFTILRKLISVICWTGGEKIAIEHIVCLSFYKTMELNLYDYFTAQRIL